jgi:hypothetical protein
MTAVAENHRESAPSSAAQIHTSIHQRERSSAADEPGFAG